jgi:UDP-N-acetylmuramate dehydrogenase
LNRIAAALLEEGFRGKLLQREPLDRHSSLRVGGPARVFAVPEDEEDLAVLSRVLQKGEWPWIVVGGGTNILFGNGGYPGCVISLGKGFSSVHLEDDGFLFAGSSLPLPSLVARSGEEGLSGMECLSGIPGTVGGAVRMNAGTRSGDISGTLVQAHLFYGEKARWVDGNDLGFSYRSSRIGDGEIIMGARFRLERSSREAVRRRIREQIVERKKKQPTVEPSAGCWFRNPQGDSAGRLIDKAGLKGTAKGGAQVSHVHANFLVNTGGARSEDFLALAEDVRQTVLEKFGVHLEEEVRVVHG